MVTSQSLTPTLQQHGSDTLFCWTISQSRTIAQHIEAGKWCDSISNAQQRQIQQLDTLASIHLQQLQTCQHKALNLALLDSNHRQATSALQQQVGALKRQQKRDHRHKLVLGFGAAVATIISILK